MARQQRKADALQAQRQALSGYLEERAQAQHVSALKTRQKQASGEIIVSVAEHTSASSVTGGNNTGGAGVHVNTTAAESVPESVQLISMRQIKAVAQQMLGALTVLKGMRIIHADIKPQNICVKNPGFIQYLVDHFALPGSVTADGERGFPQAGKQGKTSHFAHTLLGLEVVLIDFSCSAYEGGHGPASEAHEVHGSVMAEATPALPVQIDVASEVSESSVVDHAVEPLLVISTENGEQPTDGFEVHCGSDAPVIDGDSGILFFDHQHTHSPGKPPPNLSNFEENMGDFIGPSAGTHDAGVGQGSGQSGAMRPEPRMNKYIQSRYYRAPEVLLEHPYGKRDCTGLHRTTLMY